MLGCRSVADRLRARKDARGLMPRGPTTDGDFGRLPLGSVAHLERAPGFEPGGSRFDSCPGCRHHLPMLDILDGFHVVASVIGSHAPVAQPGAEHQHATLGVGGSSPSGRAIAGRLASTIAFPPSHRGVAPPPPILLVSARVDSC